MFSVLLACLSLGLSSCQPQNPTRASGTGISGQPTRLKVTATFSILADWVRAVGGDRVEVTSLVGPDQDTHAWEASPRDQIILGQTQIIFAIGLGYESWLDKLVVASGTKAGLVEVTQGMELIHAGRVVSPGLAAEHMTEYDPHIWHSVAKAKQSVTLIADRLGAIDPEGAPYYKERARIYTEKLTELDSWIRTQTAGIPENKRSLLTNHDTFAYFARDYGYTLMTSVFEGVSTEGAEPSARQRAELSDRLKASGLPAVFVENMANPKILQQAAQTAGIRLAPTLYTDALGPEGNPAADYLGLMRYNVGIMVEYLGDTK